MTVGKADQGTTQWASDEAGRPGNLAIVPTLLVATLLEADYPSLQEKPPLLHGLQCIQTGFDSKNNYCRTGYNGRRKSLCSSPISGKANVNMRLDPFLFLAFTS